MRVMRVMRGMCMMRVMPDMPAVSIEGILVKRTSGTPYIAHGERPLWWLEKRLAELPDGAYVRFTAEVIDPEPERA